MTKKFAVKLSYIRVGSGIRDLVSGMPKKSGSGIREKPIPDPGGLKGTGSRIRICNTDFPDPQHWYIPVIFHYFFKEVIRAVGDFGWAARLQLEKVFYDLYVR